MQRAAVNLRALSSGVKVEPSGSSSSWKQRGSEIPPIETSSMTSPGTSPGLSPPLDAEALLERFERAWRHGAPPRIEDYLPVTAATREGKADPERRALLEELVMLDLEYRWRRATAENGLPKAPGPIGERPRLEEYTPLFPGAGAAGEPIRRIDRRRVSGAAPLGRPAGANRVRRPVRPAFGVAARRAEPDR